MPFKLDCTPTLQQGLGLPEKLDDKHRYHYLLFTHSDGNATYIRRSYHHCSESFSEQVLMVGKDMFLVEEKTFPLIYEISDILLYAEPNISVPFRKKLSEYLSDILHIRQVMIPHTKNAKPVNLQIVDSTAFSRSLIGRFPND
jgi:hypothetical protein